jgi:hypothetical protein
MIDSAQRDKALQYLAETDESCANARALMLFLESKEKTILAMGVLQHGEGTAQTREARARTAGAYLEWLEQYRESVADYELQRNKRKRAELTVECWRSENANRRNGNV